MKNKIIGLIEILVIASLLLGLAVSKKPTPSQPRLLEDPSEKLERKEAVEAEHIPNMMCPPEVAGIPDWVVQAVREQMPKASYTDAARGYKALQERNWDRFREISDQYRSRRFHRERPPLDGESHEMTDWTNDRRVNNVGDFQQFQPAVVTGSDGTIYVTWGDDNNYNSWGIYFSKSTDDGLTFTPRLMVDGSGPNIRPRIAVNGTGSSARVYIAYSYIYNEEEYDYDIYLAYSVNGGSSFPYMVAVAASGWYEDLCDIEVDASNYVYIAYTYGWVDEGGSCDPDEAEVDIILCVSYNGGSSWRTPRFIAGANGRDEVLPTLAVFGAGNSSTLHVGYCYEGSGYDVHYRRVLNAGSSGPSVGGAVGISATGYDDYIVPGGITTCSDGHPHLVYTYMDVSNLEDVYYRRSYNYGASFASPIAVVTFVQPQIDPCIEMDPFDIPFVAWRDERNGNPDIYMNWYEPGLGSFREPLIVSRDPGAGDQYWPGLGMYRQPYKRRPDVVWWDCRYDEGDIYYNGNLQYCVQLTVEFTPDMYYLYNTGFYWRSFDVYHDTAFVNGNYQIWYDPEYANDPLLDQYWGGSTEYERWAGTPQPISGWDFVPPDFWSPNTPGAYSITYWHQYRVDFTPVKGNPPACDHPMPNAFLRYYTFGRAVDTTINLAAPVIDWVDKNSAYIITDTIALTPFQRWASVSTELTGTIIGPTVVDPEFFHQWKPRVFFAGLSDTNTVCTEQHYQCEVPHLECDLWEQWTQWTDCGAILEFEDTSTCGFHAIDPTTIVDTTYFITTIRYVHEVGTSVRNDFGYGQVMVDGELYDSPYIASWGPGTEHTITALSPQTFGDSLRFVFTGWSDGGDSSHIVVVPTYDITYIAYFQQQFHITLDWAGETGGHIPVLTGEGWYDMGVTATITATSGYDSLPDVRHGFSHWSSNPPEAYLADSMSDSTTVLVDGWYELTAHYSVQYAFEVYNPAGYDDPYPPVGTWWFDAASAVIGSVHTSDPVFCMYCSGYIGTGSLVNGDTNHINFIINEPSSVEWQWAPQLYLEVTSEYGLPTPPTGFNCITPGRMVHASVASPFYMGANIRAACMGWIGTGSVPDSGSAPFVDFVMEANSSITWLWMLEYRFTVENPTGYDNPHPPVGSYWFPEGTEISGWVSSPFGEYVCIGYNGTGSLASAPNDSFTFVIYSPSSVEWLWHYVETTVSLTVNSLYGEPRPYGTTYYTPGAPVVARVTSPWYGAVDGERYICEGWVGTGSAPPTGTDTLTAFVINVNSAITWLWHTQYRFTVNNPEGYDSPNPPVGDHWYDDGTLVTGNITSPIEDTIICYGFEGTGSLETDTLTYFSFNIDEPSSITWLWFYGNYSLEVVSPYGTPDPPVGVTMYPPGTEINAWVDPFVLVTDGERHFCTGFIGTGSVPSSGVGNSVTFVINFNSTITWEWSHQYRFIVDNPGGYGSPSPVEGEHWYDDGAIVAANVTSPDGDMCCVGYYGSGDLPPLVYGYDYVNFVITQPSSISWIWYDEALVASLEIFSDHGAPEPTVGIHYYPIGAEVTAYNQQYLSIGIAARYFCQGYIGTGSVPASGSDTLVTFIINENSTLEWDWVLQYMFQVDNPGGWDDPVPPVGEHWFNAGTEVTGYVTSPDDTMYCIGYDGTGSLPDGHSPFFSFIINMPSSIVWHWGGETNIVQLTVVSPYGDPVPPVGTMTLLRGTLVDAFVQSYVEPDTGIRCFCDGWIGTGSVPIIGGDTLFWFAISVNSTIEWLWTVEYFLDLDYTGTTGYVPTQTGEGWYEAGTEVTITTESPFLHGGSYYALVEWEPVPDRGTIANPVLDSTTITMDTTFLVTAIYNNAVQCTVRKDPLETLGSIFVDGEEFPGAEEVFWWAIGSSHEIGVSSPDEAADTRYVFDEWSDAGARFHNTAPITEPTTFIAYYHTEYRVTVEKDPYEEFGWIEIDRSHYDETGIWSGWIAEGSNFWIQVSAVDVDTFTGIIYYFDYWSDGGAVGHYSGALAGPLHLIAYYTNRVTITIIKEPVHSYGFIEIDGVRYEGVPSQTVSVDFEDIIEVGVSNLDVGPDSVYTFSHWSDAGDRFHEVGPMITDDTLIAYYTRDELIFAFTVTPLEWHIGLIDVAETISMTSRDVFNIVNEGNVPMRYGLQVTDPGRIWIPGYTFGVNQFSLRGRFHPAGEPAPAPSEYNAALDFIKAVTLTWASELQFGPRGYYEEPDTSLNLWMQFGAPTSSSEYDTEQTIEVTIWAEVSPE